MLKTRRDWAIVALVLVFAVSCSGNGCGGCGSLTTIPGGFASGKRNPNAAQLRVSSGGLASITSDPAALVGGLLGSAGSGGISFDVPASCGGSADICCAAGTPMTPCGPLDIDLTQYAGDTPRLTIAPEQGSDTVTVTINARVKSAMYIPITISAISTTCRLSVDTMQGATTHGANQDMTVVVALQFAQDATAGTTRVVVGTPKITIASGALTLAGDGSIGNDIACAGEGFVLSALLTTVEGLLATQVQGAIQDQLCKACPTGDVAECGPFATSCTNNVCDEGSGSGTCLQELGLEGRALGSSLLASISPGTTGALDLYEVAGGYGTTDSGGIALGLLGGMEPGGSARDRCGPVANEPAPVTITPSAFFEGNTRPDTGAPFDVAIGVHKSQLDQFAYAAYNGGILCITVTHDTVAELSTATFSLVARSLNALNEKSAPVAVGLRPQSPPVITLGTNTFTTSGSATTLADPLLDLKFTAMELDFFAAVDDQYIRIFTVVADVDLPIGLQVGAMGELTPVLGDVANAFTNLSVKNSEAVTESPAQLAAVFPQILNLVLPQLSAGFSPIALPSIGGLQLSVTDITAVPQAVGGTDLSYLAIFANLAPPSTMIVEPVHTTMQLAAIDAPADAIARDPTKWAGAQPPRVTVALGATAADVEYSYRLDRGMWSAWNASPRPTISSGVLWLAGTHDLEARARRIGHPETIDRTPAKLQVQVGQGAPSVARQIADVNGTGAGSNGAGCACDSSGGPGGAAPLALLIAIGLLVPRRRGVLRAAVRRVASLGPFVWIAALASLPGCSCHSDPCGSAACMPGAVAIGAIGQWTSIAGDDQRVMVATYDQGLGDLVAVDATDPANLTYTAVDGVPDEPPSYDPSTYRGGIGDAGPNVGAWTSILLSEHTARIAYQDRDALALKYAYESKSGSWSNYTIDSGSGEAIGQYAAMILDSAGNPAIAYLAIGADDGAGHKITELRLARTTSADPLVTDWETETIASAPGTCAGLCDASEACVAGSAATDPQTCVTPTTDCAAACGSGSACVTGACVAAIPDPTVTDIPTGTGLFVHLVTLSTGQMVASYYDRTRRALVLAVEVPGTPNYLETVVDGNVVGADRGMWSSAVVDATDTVHLAYQDALGDQLMYATWNGMTGMVSTPEVVDDGERSGDRPHPVGASSAIYLSNGSPAIAYQDGMTADLMLATRAGSTWSTTGVATGPLLDGFSISVTTGHGSTPVFAWDSIDPSQAPPNTLAVQSP